MSYRVSPEEIIWEWQQREADIAPGMQTARLVNDVYNSDVAVPLPASASPEEKLSIANFVEITIDHNAQRIVSVTESIETFPSQPGVKKYETQARMQRLVSLDWLDENRVRKKGGRWARQYVAYGAAATMITPNRKLSIPWWDRKDPLAALPGYRADPDEVHPPDCIFPFTRPWSWVLRNYPDEAGMLYVGEKKPQMDDLFDLVEYIDDEQHTLLVVGRQAPAFSKIKPSGVYSGVGKRIIDGGPMGGYGSHEACVLEQAQNRAGVCTAITPGRITLSRRKGQADGQIPLFFRLQRLTALWDEAIDRGVYPEEWIVNPNGEARVVVQADGRRGIVGEITNGQIVTRDLNPGYQTPAVIASLERSVRIEGPLPAEATGESPTNVRTARRGAEILSSTLDFGLAEDQMVLADARRAELEVAAEVQKGYFGNKTLSLYVRDEGAKSYKPNDLFDGVRYRVTFPLPGADANQLYMRSLSKVGGDALSRRTAMRMDPDIDDVESEMDQINSEKFNALAFDLLGQGVLSGQFGIDDLATIEEAVRTDRQEMIPAIKKAHDAKKELQAAPPDPNSPEGQDGIVPPGMETLPPQGPPSLEALLGSIPNPAQAA